MLERDAFRSPQDLLLAPAVSDDVSSLVIFCELVFAVVVVNPDI